VEPGPAVRQIRGLEARSPAGQRPLRRVDARWLICILLLVAALIISGIRYWTALPATAFTGTAWVIDGDSVVISKTRIRLEGIDAPESAQDCTDTDGKPWPCGARATRELRNYIRGQEIACEEKALDRYKRVLAICKLPDGSDINAWMVRQGWAVAYGFDKMYQAAQDEAELARRGIWSGTFTTPSEWRRANPRRDPD
jgi:endonuclease YncB( thermonuclease family)